MSDGIREALLISGQVVDITTTGRRTGRAHRIEVRLHNVGGELYISGSPDRPRDWYANMLARPQFTLHLKGDVSADVVADAAPVLDEDERRRVLHDLLEATGRLDEMQARMTSSPLVQLSVTLPE